ncbi:RNA 3'-terminal phosphate cyclase [Frankliniella fusca]|uniref:RNA 3'-terminal phosphate cyclase n=1 Tax=Frankliniella fusca TaxID=407009 RepID=A0AAE1HMR3_9NEOP|nr:RNA 3'-terminal phosphate cyclase [Frankliniella fusca]
MHHREDFLSNTKNKSSLIRLLREHLHAAGVDAKQADADADTMIAEEALLGAAAQSVTVVTKDTDIVAILIARGSDLSEITVKSPGAGSAADRIFAIGSIRKQLGEMADCVLAAHAFTGCDTTSAIFRKGKLKAWDILKQNEDRRGAARTFNDPHTDKEEIVACGEKLFMALYPKVKGVASLDELRYYEYGRLVAKKSPMHVPLLADLPPTSEGARQHSLRVYLTVQGWLGNSLDPTEWGWQARIQKCSKEGGKVVTFAYLPRGLPSPKGGGNYPNYHPPGSAPGGWCRGDRSLHPVPSTLQPAPEELLKLVACNCKSGCKEGSGCSCRKANLTCSTSCGACRGECCSNTVAGDEADWDSF